MNFARRALGDEIESKLDPLSYPFRNNGPPERIRSENGINDPINRGYILTIKKVPRDGERK